MTLILCVSCGHPWIHHGAIGCDELIDGPEPYQPLVCGCRHLGSCDGCTLADEAGEG